MDDDIFSLQMVGLYFSIDLVPKQDRSIISNIFSIN